MDNGDGTFTLGTDGEDFGLLSFGSSSSQSNLYYADIGECFEFTLLESTGNISVRMNINGGSNRNIIYSTSSEWVVGSRIRLTVVENGVKISVNGISRTVTLADTGARYMTFRLENNSSIKIKDWCFYPV